jgi:hypothetical protein
MLGSVAALGVGVGVLGVLGVVVEPANRDEVSQLQNLSVLLGVLEGVELEVCSRLAERIVWEACAW